MPAQRLQPTPHADVNAVLRHFHTSLQAELADRLVGMYVSGSLALGDFVPDSSDIDFVVVTDGELSDEHVLTLQALHAQFDASGSPWATEVEAA